MGARGRARRRRRTQRTADTRSSPGPRGRVCRPSWRPSQPGMASRSPTSEWGERERRSRPVVLHHGFVADAQRQLGGAGRGRRAARRRARRHRARRPRPRAARRSRTTRRATASSAWRATWRRCSTCSSAPQIDLVGYSMGAIVVADLRQRRRARAAAGRRRRRLGRDRVRRRGPARGLQRVDHRGAGRRGPPTLDAREARAFRSARRRARRRPRRAARPGLRRSIRGEIALERDLRADAGAGRGRRPARGQAARCSPRRSRDATLRIVSGRSHRGARRPALHAASIVEFLA